MIDGVFCEVRVCFFSEKRKLFQQINRTAEKRKSRNPSTSAFYIMWQSTND